MSSMAGGGTGMETVEWLAQLLSSYGKAEMDERRSQKELERRFGTGASEPRQMPSRVRGRLEDTGDVDTPGIVKPWRKALRKVGTAALDYAWPGVGGAIGQGIDAWAENKGKHEMAGQVKDVQQNNQSVLNNWQQQERQYAARQQEDEATLKAMQKQKQQQAIQQFLAQLYQPQQQPQRQQQPQQRQPFSGGY